MKATFLDHQAPIGPVTLRLDDLPIPEPAFGEVRVKISCNAESAILLDAFAYAIPAR